MPRRQRHRNLDSSFTIQNLRNGSRLNGTRLARQRGKQAGRRKNA